MLDVTEQHGRAEIGRVEGLRADVRVQPGGPAPARDGLPPNLVAEVCVVGMMMGEGARRAHSFSATGLDTTMIYSFIPSIDLLNEV